MTTTTTNCQFCGKSHGLRCPDVKAIEYFEDGRIKRVEFTTLADCLAPYSLQPMPVGPITFGQFSTVDAAVGASARGVY